MTNDDWFTCPVCGEVVREGALACPSCGADDETGWSEEASYDDLAFDQGLDDEAFGESTPHATRQSSTLFRAAAVLLIIVILIVWFVAGF